MVKVPGLAEARHRALLTQAELAAKVRMHWVSISRLERGQDARASTVRRLTRALKVSPAELLGSPHEEGED
jgi:predicted transcriptional regulator